jgi:hypothetical protein
VADLGPNKKRIAQLVRMLGSNGGERKNAWTVLERAMQSAGVSWSDIGNAIEHGGERDDGKFSEAEMQEFGQALRAEAIEAGIKIGLARAGNGLTLPKPAEMADYCHQRAGKLKDDAQRKFVSDMLVITQRGRTLFPKQLGYLTSIYIQNGGKT